MDFKKMWGKFGSNAVKTGVAGGLVAAGVTGVSSSTMGLEEVLTTALTAVVTASVTAFLNWLKHKND